MTADKTAGGLERIGRRLARFLLIAAAVILCALLLLTAVDVVGRYLLNAPVNGKTELSRFMMAGLIAAALPVIGVTGGHISVDLLDRFFRGRIAAIRDLLIDGMAAFSLFVLGYWLLFRADRLQSRGYVSDFLHLPLHPVAYFIAFMVIASGLALVAKMAISILHVAHPDHRSRDMKRARFE